jgi:hypothetical protein
MPQRRSEERPACPLRIRLLSHLQPAPGLLPDPSSNWSCWPPEDEAVPGRHLSLKNIRQLVNAEAFAASRRWPLCAHVTVHFRLAEGFTEETWSAFQTDLLDRAARWLTRRSLPVAFVWTRENGQVKGPHLHWLLHLPHAYWTRFKAFLLHAGRFEVSDAGGEAIRISGGAFGMLAPTMRAGVLRYICKSADCSDRTMDALGIRPSPTLPVHLKRCAASHTIGLEARRLAGWKEMRALPELRAHLAGGADAVTV